MTNNTVGQAERTVADAASIPNVAIPTARPRTAQSKERFMIDIDSPLTITKRRLASLETALKAVKRFGPKAQPHQKCRLIRHGLNKNLEESRNRPEPTS